MIQESKTMSNQASERLKQNAKKIMQMWEEQARNQVSASMEHDSLVLQDSLPQYLNQLIDELSTKIERTPIRIGSCSQSVEALLAKETKC